MTASQMRIAETIDAFYGDAGANDGVSRSYKQAVEDLDAETIKALDGPFRYVWLSEEGGIKIQASSQFDRQTVLEPISRFCAYFPDINECKLLPSHPFSLHRRIPIVHALLCHLRCTNVHLSPRHKETQPQTVRLRCYPGSRKKAR